MRTALRLAPQVLGAVVVLVVLLAIHKLPTERSLAIWVVLLTAIALLELVRGFGRHEYPKPVPVFERAVRSRMAPDPAPSAFAGMEREIALATGTADHAHRKFLPLLRTTAAARLATRHGVELERRPDVARRLLGAQVWELLRPDRPEPDDRLGPGLSRDEIAAVVDRLESL
jgi:hypothetical protein